MMMPIDPASKPARMLSCVPTTITAKDVPSLLVSAERILHRGWLTGAARKRVRILFTVDRQPPDGREQDQNE